MEERRGRLLSGAESMLKTHICTSMCAYERQATASKDRSGRGDHRCTRHGRTRRGREALQPRWEAWERANEGSSLWTGPLCVCFQARPGGVGFLLAASVGIRQSVGVNVGRGKASLRRRLGSFVTGLSVP